MKTVEFDPRVAAMLLKLKRFPIWIDFDEEAKVLCISLEKSQKADGSILGNDGNIYHYNGTVLVGITILNISIFN